MIYKEAKTAQSIQWLDSWGIGFWQGWGFLVSLSCPNQFYTYSVSFTIKTRSSALKGKTATGWNSNQCQVLKCMALLLCPLYKLMAWCLHIRAIYTFLVDKSSKLWYAVQAGLRTTSKTDYSIEICQHNHFLFVPVSLNLQAWHMGLRHSTFICSWLYIYMQLQFHKTWIIYCSPLHITRYYSNCDNNSKGIFLRYVIISAAYVPISSLKWSCFKVLRNFFTSVACWGLSQESLLILVYIFSTCHLLLILKC